MKQNKNILKNPGVQSLLTSLLCILLGLFIGYLVLLLINPTGAWGAITNVMKNFLTYSSAKAQLKYLGNTLVRTAPLLMCSLSVLFVYKVGLFNIGAAGQYVAGACACLYAALYLHWHWLPCMLLAIAAGALLGVISGLLKSSFNVSEVISGIMLNWIALYITNMLLTNVKEATSPYTYQLKAEGPQAILPQISLSKLLSSNQYVTIAIPIAIVCAVVIWVVLSKTLFGYELKATGNNPNAAKYCGMAEKSATSSSRSPSAARWQAWALRFCTRRAMSSGSVPTPPSLDGLQRHRRRLPRRSQPDRLHLRLVLHPAYHRRRRIRRQIPLLLADLRSDLRDHHLPVQLRAVLQDGAEQLDRAA